MLIPNLLNARARAFDTGAQTCLKGIVTAKETVASVDPWTYDGTTDGTGIESCTGVTVTATGPAPEATFAYTALHDNGSTNFEVSAGRGVTAQ